MNNFEDLCSCSICFSHIDKQIYQCENGHICCDTCINHINHCSTCRTKNFKIRNLVLENFRDNFLKKLKDKYDENVKDNIENNPNNDKYDENIKDNIENNPNNDKYNENIKDNIENNPNDLIYKNEMDVDENFINEQNNNLIFNTLNYNYKEKSLNYY
jgi:hypothetical protein